MGKKMDSDSHVYNYSRCMLSAFQNFRQNEFMLDVTLSCNGKSIKAHKLVLASCSQYFKDLFSENPCDHPIVILRDSDFEDLRVLIDFIYKGEFSVSKERLKSVLKIAEDLDIRGLKLRPKERCEKLYNQIFEKMSSRKKRKRHRHNSTDSEENKCIKISDSDDVKSNADDEALLESQVKDVESENLGNENAFRPFVLHVGDLSTGNEESIPKNEMDKGNSKVVNSDQQSFLTDDAAVGDTSITEEDIEAENYEVVTENIELSSQFDVFPEKSNPECPPGDKENISQDHSMESVPVSEDVEKHLVDTPSSSTKSSESQQYVEIKSPDEGKRFVCSKCDSVFTSRINFMRHKASGHSKTAKTLHKCQHCTFITQDMDCLERHLLSHNENVPFKCTTCSKEFSSEDIYQKHVSLHEVEEIALHGFSAIAGQDLFSTPNKNSAKNSEFRCSICFDKFPSKLGCQIHEKTCQGGS